MLRVLTFSRMLKETASQIRQISWYTCCIGSKQTPLIMQYINYVLGLIIPFKFSLQKLMHLNYTLQEKIIKQAYGSNLKQRVWIQKSGLQIQTLCKMVLMDQKMSGNGYELYLMLTLNIQDVDVEPSVNVPAVNALKHYGNLYQHVVVMVSIALIQWTINCVNYKRL